MPQDRHPIFCVAHESIHILFVRRNWVSRPRPAIHHFLKADWGRVLPTWQMVVEGTRGRPGWEGQTKATAKIPGLLSLRRVKSPKNSPARGRRLSVSGRNILHFVSIHWDLALNAKPK